MAKQKRGLFQRDLGNHPPPLDEFIADWHRNQYQSGGFRYGLWRKARPGEVAANARWFGKALAGVATGVLVFLLWRRDFRGEIVVLMVGSVIAAIGGVLLVRAGKQR